MDTLRQWLRTISGDRRILFLLGLLAVGSIALILAGGYGVELFQPRAAQYCTQDGEDLGCESFCSSRGQSGSCEGLSCRCEGTATGEDTECNPVTSPGWINAASPKCTPFPTPPAVTPPPFPDNWSAHIEVSNPGGLPGLATSAPYGVEDGYTCFGFTVPDGNEWALVDAHTGGTVPVPKTTHTLTGTFFNNCPWDVEMTGGAAVSPKSGSDYIFNEDGTIDEPSFGADNIVTRGTTQLIPSCWNYPHVQTTSQQPAGTNTNTGSGPTRDPVDRERPQNFEPSLIRPVSQLDPYMIFRYLFGSNAYAQAVAGAQAGCTGEYTISFDVTFSAGRAEISLGWKHHDKIGSRPGGATVIDGYGIVADTGRDCTGAPGEKCATDVSNESGGGGGGGAGGPTHATCEDGNPWDDKPDGYEGAYDDLDRGTQLKCDDAHQACYSVWPQRKFHKVEACMAGEPWSYNGMSSREWSSYIRGWEAWIEENCGGWEDGSTSLDELLASYEAFLAPFNAMEIEGAAEEGGKQFNDEGITSVCRCPKGASFSFHYFICNTTNTVYSCEKPTLACFEGGDVNNPEIEACAQFGYIDRDEDGRCEPPGSEVPAACGDGACSDDETCANCSADCGTCQVATCGDDVCNGGESCSTCAEDCGVCTDTCGDEVCGTGETCSTCASDCGSCASTTRTPTPRPVTITITPTPTASGTGGTGGTGSTNTGGQVGSAAATPTGPGEVTVLALLLAGLTALLYVSYTHTDVFRQHEAEHLGHEQDPMDFRQ